MLLDKNLSRWTRSGDNFGRRPKKKGEKYALKMSDIIWRVNRFISFKNTARISYTQRVDFDPDLNHRVCRGKKLDCGDTIDCLDDPCCLSFFSLQSIHFTFNLVNPHERDFKLCWNWVENFLSCPVHCSSNSQNQIQSCRKVTLLIMNRLLQTKARKQQQRTPSMSN